jgi:hypothetical protein
MIEYFPGDVCQIKVHTRTGEKAVKALLIEEDVQAALWLLVVYIPPEGASAGIKSIAMDSGREIGYSAINTGNLMLDNNVHVIKRLGHVSARQHSHICCEIFASNQAWKLERIRFPKSTGINFWINFVPYKGIHVPGMRQQCQVGDTP